MRLIEPRWTSCDQALLQDPGELAILRQGTGTQPAALLSGSAHEAAF